VDWLSGLLGGRNMDSRIVERIRKLVEEECKTDTNTFGDEIWTYHILSVVRYGKFLARKLHADEEIVEIAALLHDIAGIKDRDNYENHHLLGAEDAEKILKRFKYPQESARAKKKSKKSSIVFIPTEGASQLTEKLSKQNALQVPMRWHTLTEYLHFFTLFLLNLERI
jgi:putative nucleotidyltransferase with HDIG domain